MDTTQEIYLDNSATTRVSKEAAEKALYMMTECYGNPSSLHSKGFAAEKEMTAAREIIAERLSAQPGEIYFTSGGTESDNIAILGAAHAKKRAGNKIVTTAIEHPAVLNTMAQLEKEGFEVVYVQPEADGNIPKVKFDAAIDAKTILVSVMAVNNETGVLLPLKDIAGMIKRKKAPALFHTDAVQGFCKIPLQPKKLGVDLISVSGHKVHAPKRRTHFAAQLRRRAREKSAPRYRGCAANLCVRRSGEAHDDGKRGAHTRKSGAGAFD